MFMIEIMVSQDKGHVNLWGNLGAHELRCLLQLVSP